MVRIMYRRIVIRGDLFAENIEEIFTLENEDKECDERNLHEASNYSLKSVEDDDPQDSDSEEVFLTKSDVRDVGIWYF